MTDTNETDDELEPTTVRLSPRVELPKQTLAPDAPPVEQALDALRYVPSPEILALTEAAEVVAELGRLEERDEIELVSAWARAHNRAALNAVAVYIAGPVGDRAARALKALLAEAENT